MGTTFWALVFIFAAVLEIAVPVLISFWFAISAILTIFFSIFFKDVILQFFFFSTVSLVFVLVTRPFISVWGQGKRKEEKIFVNIERVISLKNRYKEYEVRYKGSIWNAISTEILEGNDRVYIAGFKGNRIVLKKEREERKCSE